MTPLLWVALACLPMPVQCEQVACTENHVEGSSLVCLDTDDVYHEGHWIYDSWYDSGQCLDLAVVDY